MHRRAIESVSLSKSNFNKESKLSCDTSDKCSKLSAYKTMKGSIKDCKKSCTSSNKHKKATSQLNKHIETTLSYKSTYDKNVASLKKLKNKHVFEVEII